MRHIRHSGQIGNIKDSLVCLPVTSDQPRAVNRKYDRQILDTDIM